MRPQKVGEQRILDGVMSVIQTKGYDGASLNDFAAATGLQKASLYHRFPGGKIEMTLLVLSFVENWIKEHIHDLILKEDLPKEVRLKMSLTNVYQLYDGGKKSCLLRILSLDSQLEAFGKKIEESMQNWIKAYTLLGTEFGLGYEQSEQLAARVLIQVQGSLMVSKGLNSPSIFSSTLSEIEMWYLTVNRSDILS